MSDNFTTDAEKASYGIGLQMGEQLKSNPFEGLNLNSVFEGMKDAYAGSAFQVEIPEIQAAFEKINEEIQARREEEAKVLSLPWYYNISNWDNLRNYLGSENKLDRPSKDLLGYHEWNLIGEDNEE